MMTNTEQIVTEYLGELDYQRLQVSRFSGRSPDFSRSHAFGELSPTFVQLLLEVW